MKKGILKRLRAAMLSPFWGIAISILFVAAILAILIFFDIHEQVIKLLEWFVTLGAWAPLLFILVMGAVTILLLPGVLFTTGAGFVFGILEGSIVVVVGTTLGATVAFLIARYFFGPYARDFILTRAKLRVLSDEMTPHGWKIILLTRLIPFFPSKISNYAFGLTAFSLRGFIIGSFFGFIPFSVHNVYLGSLAADITNLSVRNSDRTPLEWSLYLMGFFATLFAVVYLNRLAQRALAKYQNKPDSDKGDL